MPKLTEADFKDLSDKDYNLATAASWAPEILNAARSVVLRDSTLTGSSETIVAVAQVIATTYATLVARQKG